MTRVSIGKIYSIDDSSEKYTTITIAEHAAYKVNYRRFNVWNIEKYKKKMGADFKEGTFVKFFYVKKGKYYKLSDMEEIDTSDCLRCGGFTPFRNKQQMECEWCFGGPEKVRVDGVYKVVSSAIKKYAFSFGISIGLYEENVQTAEQGLLVTLVFERNPMYEELKSLEIGDKKIVKGWITEEKDDGVKYFELIHMRDDEHIVEDL